MPARMAGGRPFQHRESTTRSMGSAFFVLALLPLSKSLLARSLSPTAVPQPLATPSLEWHGSAGLDAGEGGARAPLGRRPTALP